MASINALRVRVAFMGAPRQCNARCTDSIASTTASMRRKTAASASKRRRCLERVGRPEDLTSTTAETSGARALPHEPPNMKRVA
jgi:hypothetical protein